jgi:hypothetical protein
MEDLRMNALFKHADKMDKELKAMLDNYKNYSEQKKPSICVLCSDNKLRAEVDRVFTIREDLCVDVVVTSEEIKDADEYKAMLCDALVVCTRAKNIAPKGLYDLMKHISQLDKQIYVVLAGWESLERSEKMAKSRAERVSIEYEFARIVNVTNVFSEPRGGFITWENAFDALAIHFFEKFEMLHLSQDEKIYNYLLKYVGDFYSNARTEINKEIAIVNNAERIAMAKQDYYVIRFSNLAVSVQEVVDAVKGSIEDISYYDIVDDDKNETLTDIYSRSGVEAQKYAKVFLIQEYKKRVGTLKDNSNEKVRIDNESCVAECINEMDALPCEISKLKYLPENLVKSLRVVCDERTELEKIVNRYESSAKILIDNVIDRIPAKVGEYRYQMKYSVEARDKGKDLLGLAKDSIRDYISEKKKDSEDAEKGKKKSSEKDNSKSDETKNDDNKVNSAEKPASKEIREKIKEGIVREDDEALMLERFQSDIEQLIIYSRNACGEMAQDCAKNIKQDMEKFADSILKIYFGSIIKEIQGMQTEMSKILEEYYLE